MVLLYYSPMPSGFDEIETAMNAIVRVRSAVDSRFVVKVLFIRLFNVLDQWLPAEKGDNIGACSKIKVALTKTNFMIRKER